MNRSSMQLFAILAALGVLGAGNARAQAPVQAPPAEQVRPPTPPTRAPDSAAVETHARVRGSHTVDVIAPGEKVDTILGRMRPERPMPTPRSDMVRPPTGSDSRGQNQAPLRSDPSHPGDRDGMGHEGGRDNGRMPSLPPRNDGAAPPSTSPRPPPPR